MFFFFQLDAKKSPLALLAQTCSSIGKDTSPSKSIIPPIEKKDSGKDKDHRKSSSPLGKSPATDDNKGRSSSSHDRRLDGASPANSTTSRDSPKSGFRAPAPKEIPPLVPISTSSSDKSSSSDSCTSKSATGSTPGERESTSVTSVLQHSVSATGTSAGAQSNSRISLSCGNMLLEVNHNEVASKGLHGLPASHPAALPSSKEGLTAPSALHPGLGTYPALPGLLGHPLALDSAMYQQALSAHSSLGLSAAQKAAAGAHGALSPYMTYARVKTTAGASTLVPVCKDPYCTHCQMTMQSAQLTGTCAAGCSQCNHDKSLPGVPSSLSSSALGGLPLLPPTGSSSLALSSLYPHLGLLPSHHGPYVCNWMAGSDYCGKRFSTSEELLQHLRSHTSSGEASLHAAGLAYSGLSPSLAAAAACHSHLTTPGSLSPSAALRQGYPRSLSPNSLLAARYHPYKSPLSSLGSAGLSSSSGLQSALSAYYSPYSLYGQRIGPPVAP